MSREPPTVDASAWTGMSDWPSPKDYPRPSPLCAQASLTKHIVASGVVLALGLMAFYQTYAPSKPGILRWVGMGLVALTAPAFAYVVLRRAVPSRAKPQWLVQMDSNGLSIPSWFMDVVPWSEIEQADYTPAWAIFMPMRGLHLKVRDEARFKPTTSKQWSQLVPFVSVLWLLDVPQKEMFEAIQAHRAHFGNGGHAT